MEFTCSAILFDLDGTLIDSSEVIHRYWRMWAEEHHLDFEAVMKVAGGRRSFETIAIVAPHLDARAEGQRLDEMEQFDSVGLKTFPGGLELIRSLPAERWGVVTSGNRNTATTRLNSGGFPIPKVFVTADDVALGKPHPEPYLLGAQRLGLPPAECLVVEDAPSGVQAARAAGMRVIAVAHGYPPSALRQADAVVPDLPSLRVNAENGRLRISAKTIH